MNKLDYILETSKDQDEFKNRSREHIDSIHGKGAYDSALEFAQSEEDFIATIKEMAKAPQADPRNLENKPLIDVPGLRDISTPENLYQVAGDTMDILGKVPATVLTPVTEGLRAPFKYIAENVGENTSQTPPIDSLAEFRQPGLSDKAGFSLLMKDINNSVGIKTEPAINIKSSRFPKAAQFMSAMTDPSNITAMAAEAGIATKLPVPNTVTAGKVSLDTAMSYLKSVSKNSGLFEKLAKSGDINAIAKMIQDNPSYMRYDPKKVFDELNGMVQEGTNRRVYGDGDIARLNIRRGEIIENSPFDETNVVDPRMLRDMAIADTMDPLLLNTDAIPAEKIIKNEIITNDPNPSVIKTIDDVNNAKFRLGNIDSDINSKKAALRNDLLLQRNNLIGDVENIPTDIIDESFPMMPKQVANPEYQAAIQKIDQLNYELKNIAERKSTAVNNKKLLSLIDKKRQLERFVYENENPKLPDQRSYDDYIDRINQMKLSDVVALRKKGNAMYNPDPTQMRVDQAPMTIAGRGIVRAADEVLSNALDSGAKETYQWMGQDMKNKMALSELIQGNLRPSNNQGVDPGAMTYRAGVARSVLGDPFDRGIRPAASRLADITKNIPRNTLAQPLGKAATTATIMANEVRPDKNAVMNFKIPRTSAGVVENMPMVRRKVEMFFGPEALAQLDSVDTTEELQNVMKTLSGMDQNAFESSSYNSFDGYITDEALKKKAIGDIMRAGGNPAELADKVKALIDEGFMGK